MTPNFFKADQTERKSDSSSSNHSSNSNHVSSATAEALVVAPSVRQTVEVLVTSSSSGKGVGRTRRVEALLHSLKVIAGMHKLSDTRMRVYGCAHIL